MDIFYRYAMLIEGVRCIGKSTVALKYAWALGECNIVDYIRDCFEKETPLHDMMHKKALFLFKEYMLVGGMPKAIYKFIEMNKQFKECDLEKRIL